MMETVHSLSNLPANEGLASVRLLTELPGHTSDPHTLKLCLEVIPSRGLGFESFQP
jgi:hypothetical protein